MTHNLKIHITNNTPEIVLETASLQKISHNQKNNHNDRSAPQRQATPKEKSSF